MKTKFKSILIPLGGIMASLAFVLVIIHALFLEIKVRHYEKIHYSHEEIMNTNVSKMDSLSRELKDLKEILNRKILYGLGSVENENNKIKNE